MQSCVSYPSVLEAVSMHKHVVTPFLIQTDKLNLQCFSSNLHVLSSVVYTVPVESPCSVALCEVKGYISIKGYRYTTLYVQVHEVNFLAVFWGIKKGGKERLKLEGKPLCLDNSGASVPSSINQKMLSYFLPQIPCTYTACQSESLPMCRK